MKKYLPLCLTVIIACTSPTAKHDQIKGFLAEWSKALAAKDELVRRYYVMDFVFPKVIFDTEPRFQYSFDITNAEIDAFEDQGDLKATIPFKVWYPDGKTPDQGKFLLTITKTSGGYLIRDMTPELAIMVGEHGRRLEARDSQSSQQAPKFDEIFNPIRKLAATLTDQYDSVVFFTEIENDTLLYVVSGSWEDPYAYDNQRDGGDYKMGVVTARNKVIVPVEYDKIYNPNGSFNGMIEAETKGLRGLFRKNGELFLPVKYDAIYPTNIAGTLAQVKQGDRYGWVDEKGNVSFDPASNANNALFQSPIQNKAILEWEFRYPGDVKVLVNPYQDGIEAMGVIIYPSYIRDLGITSIANKSVMLQGTEWGMGMTGTVVKFESVESLSSRFFALISFFMESGADAREYHTAQNDLLIVDNGMSKVSHLKKFTEDDFRQGPCTNAHSDYRTLAPGFYESKDVNGNYRYYSLSADGNLEELKSVRRYNFTKFAKIDDRYISSCRYEDLNYDGLWDAEKPNVLVIKGMSIDELDLMRNEIFAEYGFIFKTPKWKKYFESKSWYRPLYENVDHLLTEIDKHNINFILEYQRKRNGQDVKSDSIKFTWAG